MELGLFWMIEPGMTLVQRQRHHAEAVAIGGGSISGWDPDEAYLEARVVHVGYLKSHEGLRRIVVAGRSSETFAGRSGERKNKLVFVATELAEVTEQELAVFPSEQPQPLTLKTHQLTRHVGGIKPCPLEQLRDVCGVPGCQLQLRIHDIGLIDFIPEIKYSRIDGELVERILRMKWSECYRTIERELNVDRDPMLKPR